MVLWWLDNVDVKHDDDDINGAGINGAGENGTDVDVRYDGNGVNTTDDDIIDGTDVWLVL